MSTLVSLYYWCHFVGIVKFETNVFIVSNCCNMYRLFGKMSASRNSLPFIEHDQGDQTGPTCGECVLHCCSLSTNRIVPTISLYEQYALASLAVGFWAKRKSKVDRSILQGHHFGRSSAISVALSRQGMNLMSWIRGRCIAGLAVCFPVCIGSFPI
jgi:hypothetical protein